MSNDGGENILQAAAGIVLAVVTSAQEYFMAFRKQLPAAYNCCQIDLDGYIRRCRAGEFIVGLIDEVELTAEAIARLRKEVENGAFVACVLRRRGSGVRPGLRGLPGLVTVRLSDFLGDGASPITFAVVESFRNALLIRMRLSAAIPELAFEIYEAILTGDPPVLSERSLARRLGKSRKAIRRVWNATHRGHPRVGLHMFIEEWLVIAAAAKRHAGIGLRTTLARAIHVRELRLRRSSLRVFGVPFEQLRGEGLARALQTVKTDAIDPAGMRISPRNPPVVGPPNWPTA